MFLIAFFQPLNLFLYRSWKGGKNRWDCLEMIHQQSVYLHRSHQVNKNKGGQRIPRKSDKNESAKKEVVA